MMEEPVLVVMAAGMGSRYGGLKQLDPMDAEGHIIMDYSVYDAIRAGFKKVIFIIKRENESDFRSVIGDRLSRYINVDYAFQELTDIPEGFGIPEGRQKPWGTGHAVMAVRDKVHGPFAVINADDYYGVNAFRMAYEYLSENGDDPGKYMMTGFRVVNTLTEHGSVSRGVCKVDENSMLKEIHERTCIVKTAEGAAYTEDGGKTFTDIPADSIVSICRTDYQKDESEETEESEQVLSKTEGNE